MAKVIGLGGFFFKARDPKALAEWYAKHPVVPLEKTAAKVNLDSMNVLGTTEDFIPLGEVRQPSGKIVTAWALEGNFNPANLRSNTFSMPWPPGSGKSQEFPEIDRAEWFTLEIAHRKILKGQAAVLDRLAQYVPDVR